MTEEISESVIQISDNVVATIAGLAALETPGVASMSGGLSDFTKLLSGKNEQRGVRVEVGQLETIIELSVVIKYKMKIQEVCRNLQENVIDQVEFMTGLKVKQVIVKVEGIDYKEEDKEPSRVV
jgi:uncharacterized alkaline shock family protein YloU